MKLTPPFSADRPLLPYLLVLSSVFAAAFVAGYFAPASARQQVMEAFQSYLDQFQDMAGGTLFFFLLLHNVTASLLLVGAGLLYGIIPTLAICSNGFVLGIVYRQGAEMLGHKKAALEVLPHGVFEIPALLFAAAYGLWLGATVIRRMRGKKHDPLRYRIEHAFRRYFAVAFPLLIVAADIETFLMLR